MLFSQKGWPVENTMLISPRSNFWLCLRIFAAVGPLLKTASNSDLPELTSQSVPSSAPAASKLSVRVVVIRSSAKSSKVSRVMSLAALSSRSTNAETCLRKRGSGKRLNRIFYSDGLSRSRKSISSKVDSDTKSRIQEKLSLGSNRKKIEKVCKNLLSLRPCSNDPIYGNEH